MSKLDEAFAAVDAVHRSEQFDANGEMAFQYLHLDCLGTIDENGGNEVWAATFDYVSDDSEWYERSNIGHHPTAFRASSPEDALLGAVDKFWKLTK